MFENGKNHKIFTSYLVAVLYVVRFQSS